MKVGGPQQGFGPKPKGGSGLKPKGGSGQKTPPGWAKAGGMPPGLAKKYGDGFDGGQDGNAQGGWWNQPSGDGGLFGGIFNWAANLFGFGRNNNNDYLGYANSTPQAVNGQKPAVSTQPPVDLGGSNSLSANAKPLPFVSQYSPTGADANYKNAQENCGPAVLAMIGKSLGLEPATMNDAQYITDLMAKAGTNANGTTGNGMISALQDMGLQTAANPGADLNWINSQLQQGHEVLANGDFYSIAQHWDDKLMSGHYVAVTGVDNGVYTVMDPANPDNASIKMTADQLYSFITNHPQGGFTLAAW